MWWAMGSAAEKALAVTPYTAGLAAQQLQRTLFARATTYILEPL